MKTLSIVSLAAMLAFSACESGTGGELIDVELELATQPQKGKPVGSFVTLTGYDVELAEARLSLASIFVYAPDSESQSALRSFFVSRARAHGGFDPFSGKRVRIEYGSDKPLAIDLLAEQPRVLGQVTAEAGAMSSSTLVFGAEVDGMQAQAWVKGTARRGGESFAFEGALKLEDEVLLHRVDGIKASGTLSEGGKLRISILPHVWFEEAHFDRLPTVESGARRIGEDTQVHTAWMFGARSTQAYETLWRK